MTDMNGDIGTGGQTARKQTWSIYCNTETVFSVKKKKRERERGLPDTFLSTRNNWIYH